MRLIPVLPRIVLLFTVLASSISGFAQYDDYNHPELRWLNFETEHFAIYYTEGLEEVAALGAQVAEEIHKPLCELYDYEPDTKVALIFSDTDDIANAASYFQNNKIFFWATSMAWDFRGTHNWLRNVVTHEYVHMIQLGAARKWSRRIPAFYGQLLGYEAERRPDVLYGYPNRVLSWPIPSVTIPAWFAEGTSQFQFDGSGYDFWDSHRDMLLRQATLAHRLLTFEEMGYFGKTSLESEGVYNQGFALTKYIVERTGDRDVLRKATHAMSNVLPVTLDQALRKATGKRGRDWYNEWKHDLELKYGALRDRLGPSLSVSDTLPGGGYVNLYPRLSPDGKRIAYISNRNRDYFGQTSLYIQEPDSAKPTSIAPAAHGALSWLPDGSGIIFSRRETQPGGSVQYDLYLYRFDDKRTIRLTRGFRAESADISPDGRTLAFTINERGRRELALAPMPAVAKGVKTIPLARKDITYRHPTLPHEQYYLPRWSPDGKRLAVAHHLAAGRGIRIFEVVQSEANTELSLVREFDGQNIELRDPSWQEDGQNLLVSWDISGISNIYRLNIENDDREQLVSVLGGAFYPDQRGTQLVYSDFCEDGFRICKLDLSKSKRGIRNSLDTELVSYLDQVPKPDFPLSASVTTGVPYRPTFEKLYWFPRIAFDYGTFKPGTYVLISDVLEKLSFLGGFAVNQKKDYDLFGLLEYRALYPTIFAEYYNVQRRLTSHFADSSRIIGEMDFRPIYDTYRIRYRYSLHEVDFGARLPLGHERTLKGMVIYDRYNAHNRFDDETSIGITYFKGWAGKIGYYTNQRRSGVSSDINPQGGYKGYIEYQRANHQFFTDLEIGGDVVGLQEVYAPYNYDLFEGGLERYFPLPGWDHTFEVRARAGAIGERVDPFFYLYAGGLPGLRGYSYYSLGGQRIAILSGTYRYPIVNSAGWSLWPLSVNRIYGSVFADLGNAWNTNRELRPNDFKKDVGVGIRLQMHSFYSYPTALALDVAYGLDKFDLVEESSRTTYGKEFRYYLTVLFDFYSPFDQLGNLHARSVP